ncbi:MAG: hypothetical protein ACRD2F_11020 [Terriglobales bacterium]
MVIEPAGRHPHEFFGQVDLTAALWASGLDAREMERILRLDWLLTKAAARALAGYTFALLRPTAATDPLGYLTAEQAGLLRCVDVLAP